MRNIIVITISMFMLSCATSQKTVPGTNMPEKIFELNSVERASPVRSEQELDKEIGSLNQYLGSYPPRFQNEEQREEIYKKWNDIQSDVLAYNRNAGDTEKSLLFMAEIHRQGHNMDVRGAGEKADSALSLCIEKYPNSKLCHLSATYFYLSIGPNFLSKAKSSLEKLRELFAPERNPEVEAGYVFYYMYSRDKENALKQIETYLTDFPNSSRSKDFRLFQEELLKTDTIEYREN
jgi:hypothetical protein